MSSYLASQIVKRVGNLPHSLKRSSLAFIAMRVCLSLWFWVIDLFGLMERTSARPQLEGLELASGGFRGLFIDVWLRWDSAHYLRIAEFGYAADERSVFYPLYPILGRIARPLFAGDAWLGLLFISNAFTFLSFYLLDRWMVSLGREEQAPWALAGLAFFPTAFFLLSGYPHSLLLALTLFGLWCMSNKRWGLAFASGLAAGLTHSIALPISVLFAAWPTERRSYIQYLVALGPPLGMMAFLAWRIHMGFPDFVYMQKAIWGREWIAPWREFVLVQAQQFLGWRVLLLRSAPNILIATASLAAVVWAARNLARQHTLYQASFVLLIIATGTRFDFLSSVGRFALSGYPTFGAFAALLNSRRRRLYLLTFSGMIQLYLSGLFALWGFVG